MASELARQEHAGAAPAPVPGARAALGVLVVDADPAMREGCGLILEQDGYGVVTSRRADEALELMKRRKFAVAVLDLGVAGTSGLKLLKACLASNPATRVIITAHPAAAGLETPEQGAWDYLPKPFTASQLQSLVARAALAGHAARALPDRYAGLGFKGADESYGTARGRRMSVFERGYLKWRIGCSRRKTGMAALVAGLERTALGRFMRRQRARRDDVLTQHPTPGTAACGRQPG